MLGQSKKFAFKSEARQKLCNGVERLANIIASTLGPGGKNMNLHTAWDATAFAKYEDQIIEELRLRDPYEEMGAAIGKEMIRKLKKQSGDGTATGVVLLHALVKKGIEQLSSGPNPHTIQRGMQKAVDLISKKLDQLAVSVQETGEIQDMNSALIPEELLAERLIDQAIKKAGPDGIIFIEETTEGEASVGVAEGITFRQGYINPYFCSDHEDLVIEMEEAYLLLTDQTISCVQEILPLLQFIAIKKRPLIIISEKLEGVGLATLIMNQMNHRMPVCAIESPKCKKEWQKLLIDLEMLTGATLISKERGMALRRISVEQLGQVNRARVTQNQTILINKKNRSRKTHKGIQERQKELERNPIERRAKERKKIVAPLQEIVTIRIGGNYSRIEIQRIKQRLEKRLRLMHVAKEGGMVPGGGIALLRAGQQVEKEILHLPPEEKIGARIVTEACSTPFIQIVKNCELNSTTILEEVLKKEDRYGFNALTSRVEDLISSQIVDHTLIIKNELKFSHFAATLILMSEVLIAAD